MFLSFQCYPGRGAYCLQNPKKPNMKPQLFAIDLILMCISCGASALAMNISAASSSLPAAHLTGLGSAHSYGTDTTVPKTRRKRYISQNDMLAILDYHNKVRGKVFPPASNMEYMVSEPFCFKSNSTWFYCSYILMILCYILWQMTKNKVIYACK